MRTRHRIPMIFSLSMMDMFCCTLGCVTLLWLVNQREVMSRTRAADDASKQLTLTRSDLASSRSAADDLKAKLAAADAALAQSRQDADATRTDLAAARSSADELSKQLTEMRTRAADSAQRLAKKEQVEKQLTRQQDAALARITDLERLTRERELQIEDAVKKLAELKKLADLLPDVRAATTDAEARAKALERELSESRQALSSSRTEGKELATQLARVKVAAEQRFEGIALTGQRVIFLIDISGSMDLIDDKTPAPLKWPTVRDTVLKILRSLPQLEKYQVILFSDKVSFPLGQPGQWFDYDPKTSADQVSAALTATKPAGNTNMYTALETAFQYRAQGLDTVYLMSDGLPNVGEGITTETARTMTETQRTDALSRAVRQALKTRWNPVLPNRARVRINSVGFFYESPDVGAFLWAMSRENDGSFVGMSRP